MYMEEWIDEDVAVMMDSDKKPWKAKLKSVDARGVVVGVTQKQASTVAEFQGLTSETEIDVFIPWFRVRFIGHGSFKGIS
jgi:hypothetical protein